MIRVIKVTRDKYGFDGWLGLCNGHPMLLKEAIAITPASKPKEEQELFQYLKKMAEEGSQMTPGDILAVWTKEKDSRPKEVTVDESSNSSTVSSITSPVSLPCNLDKISTAIV